ncbi:hypothetical protein KQX64_07150 [Rhodopseudomonas palustris]|nr:hypothetical protein KQX64_07150 [Rhodopseudomonas palustris]
MREHLRLPLTHRLELDARLKGRRRLHGALQLLPLSADLGHLRGRELELIKLGLKRRPPPPGLVAGLADFVQDLVDATKVLGRIDSRAAQPVNELNDQLSDLASHFLFLDTG